MYFTHKDIARAIGDGKTINTCNKIKEKQDININLCTVTVCSFSFMRPRQSS